MSDYNGKNLCTVIEDIKALEEKVLIGYNSNIIDNFLLSSSIARYSLAFWDPYLQEDDSQRKFWKKFFTAVADVAGGIAGATAGSAAGGPIGGIAGGVTGAAAASTAADSLWELYND